MTVMDKLAKEYVKRQKVSAINDWDLEIKKGEQMPKINKLENKEYHKLYYIKNKANFKKYRREYQRTNKYKDWLKNYQKKYRKLNKYLERKKVWAFTHNNFDKEQFCEICKDKNNLQFHHWRYRLPIQKQDFSTLCNECHNIQHTPLFRQKKEKEIDDKFN